MSEIEKLIVDWFIENQRDLPWRQSTPWGVMVSEFMLQQTPVARVLPKWNEWMLRWPSPTELASASPAEVITAWGRLGYPRRALRLLECAKIISQDFDGKVPEEISALKSLPGVGEYTAAAITSFAFKARCLVLDVNIRRLFARLLDGQGLPSSSLNSEERLKRMNVVPMDDAHVWAAATMELGALVCTSRNPKCDKCPVSALCAWRLQGSPESTIVKRTQTWHGSDRQCRGVIVQALRENTVMAKAQIMKLWTDDSQLERALQTLLVDGLIAATTEESYSLPV